MADNSILTPGYQDPSTPPVETPRDAQYLERNNYLSEYTSESEKSIVRENLNVPSKDSVYNKQDVDLEVARRIKEAIQEYLNIDDPHGIIPLVEEMIVNMVKTDGSTPFTAPQSGIDPISDTHLTTKKFVTRLLKEHINAEDPHQILPEVRDMLEKYVKTSDIYSKSQLYTKEEINKREEQFLKKDGSTPFTKAQVGADPTIDSHLTTKRYVDTVLHRHLVDVDPHGFITILNQRLSSYIRKKDVFDKTQTYSRTQIDNIISKIVENAVQSSIQEYIDTINDKFEYIRNQRYIKQDGTVPFRNPQSGVDAVEDSDLVTLRQLVKLVQDTKDTLDEKITNKECVWITSGPVETGVGMVKEGDILASQVTLQEAMDAIFYGKRVKLTTPELAEVGSQFPITLCIQGSLATVEYAEIYQDGKLVTTITREDLQESSCITVDSYPIEADSEVLVKVIYTNGSTHEVTSTVRISLPVFVGLLPKWKFGNTVTYDYLMELFKEDPTNNQFYNEGEDMRKLSHTYNFDFDELKHIFVAMPANYMNLKEMSNASQMYTLAAFDVIDMIPFQVPGSEKDVIYKLYIYKQALYSLNSSINFKFG